MRGVVVRDRGYLGFMPAPRAPVYSYVTTVKFPQLRHPQLEAAQRAINVAHGFPNGYETVEPTVEAEEAHWRLHRGSEATVVIDVFADGTKAMRIKEDE
jgi:hypothetical protein